MKNALRAQSIGEGYDPTTSAGAKSLLLQALSYHTDHEIQQDQSLTGYMEPDTGSGKESQIPESWAHSVFKDMGLPIDTRMIMNKGNVRIYLPGIQHDSVFTKNNNQLYNTLADFSYRNLQEQGLVDSFGKMYFNELEINNISTQGQGI